MKKKIVIGLAMLIALTTSLSAQAAYVEQFLYIDNVSEQVFLQARSVVEQDLPLAWLIKWVATDKLPNPIIQAINNNLRDYSLDIGDRFLSSVTYQGVIYLIYIRITNTRNSKWQFFAWRE